MSNHKLNEDRLKGKFNTLMKKFTKRDKFNSRKWNLLWRAGVLAERLKLDLSKMKEVHES